VPARPLLVPSLRGYQSAWLKADLPAGLTLAAIAIPAQMATARLAGMPTITGLYAFIAGSLVFAVFGRNPQMSVGADSTIAPAIAAAVATLAVAGSSNSVALTSVLALMTGLVVMAVGLLRLGWVAEFLSTPVVTGVLAGIAVVIAVRELPAILGIPAGGISTIARLHHTIDQLGQANGWSIGTAAVVFGVILTTERIDRRIPGALIGLAGSVLAVSVGGLAGHGVAVLGKIQGGLPSFGIRSASWGDVRHLIIPALTISFVVLAQTAATIRASKPGSPQEDDFNRDLMAIGAGSVVSGLSGSFALNASPPCTAVVTSAGGRSQLTSIVGAAVALVVVVFATGLLKDLPMATLGAILMFVATRLLRLNEIHRIFRFDRWEFGLTVSTAAAVALLGIEYGVVIAMLLSLADRTRRSARAPGTVMGRLPTTDHWIPDNIGRATEHVPGVAVYLLHAPVWYGNADFVRLSIRRLLDSAPRPVRALVLDLDGMSDIDYTGTQMLAELLDELRGRHVTVAVARSSQTVHHDLKHGGLLPKIGEDKIFSAVEEAVSAVTPPPPPPESDGTASAPAAAPTEESGSARPGS
jgi:SulP family sulfate permease